MDKQKKIGYIHWALLFGLFVYAYSTTFNVKLDIGGDNAFYIIFAKSILAGKGYASPLTPDYAPTGHFPPGYSAILAFFMLFIGDNYVLLKVLNGLFLFSSILMLYRLMWRLTGNAPFAFAVSVLLLLNKHLYMYATILMSEMPYLFFTTLALLMAWQLTESGKVFWKSWYFYLMVLAMAMTYYLRAVGITVVLAIFIHFLIQKKWGLALTSFAGFVVLYLPWVIRNSIHGIESRYLGTVMTVNPWRPEEGTISTFSEFFSKMVDNFQETVIKGFPDVLFPFLKINFREPASVLLMIGGVLVLALVLYGMWNLGKYRYLFLLYILGNIGIFLIWHGGNASRYVAPVTPFIAFGFYYGLLSLLHRIKIINLEKQMYWAYGLLVLVFFMVSPLKELGAASKRPYPPAYKNFFNIAKAVGEQTPDGITVCSRKPELFYLHANRYSVRYAYTLDDRELIEDLLKKNVDFVVLEQLGYGSTGRYLFPTIKKHPDLFKAVIQLPNPDTYLLQFDKAAARALIEQSTNSPNSE